MTDPGTVRILPVLMLRRPRSRLLAPLALVCVAAAAGMIVGSGATSERKSPPASKQKRASSAGRSTYVVREGDTLSSIALRQGITVSDLQDLNPETDSFTMQPGQRLRLRAGTR